MHDSLKPVGETHAVKTMAFVVECAVPFDHHTVKKAFLLHDQLKGDLPRRTEHRAVTVDLDQHAPPGQYVEGKSDLGGFTFDFLKSDGRAKWSLTVRHNQIIVSCSEYLRWRSIWMTAKRYFEVMFPTLLSMDGQRIAAFGLQYIDQFTWEGDVKFKAKYLFDPKTKYIAPHSFELDNLWHSYHGFFSDVSDPVEHRQLNVMNVDFRRDEEKLQTHNIIINGTHKSFMVSQEVGTEEEGDILLGSDGPIDAMEKYMGRMHVKNKEILSNILNLDVCKSIGLHKG